MDKHTHNACADARRRGVETARNRRNAEQLRRIRERIAEEAPTVDPVLAECRRGLLAFCALPASEITMAACDEVERRALAPLRHKLWLVEGLRSDAAELARELRLSEGTIPIGRKLRVAGPTG